MKLFRGRNPASPEYLEAVRRRLLEAADERDPAGGVGPVSAGPVANKNGGVAHPSDTDDRTKDPVSIVIRPDLAEESTPSGNGTAQVLAPADQSHLQPGPPLKLGSGPNLDQVGPNGAKERSYPAGARNGDPALDSADPGLSEQPADAVASPAPQDTLTSHNGAPWERKPHLQGKARAWRVRRGPTGRRVRQRRETIVAAPPRMARSIAS
jgi:hypothetical protein